MLKFTRDCEYRWKTFVRKMRGMVNGYFFLKRFSLNRKYLWAQNAQPLSFIVFVGFLYGCLVYDFRK